MVSETWTHTAGLFCNDVPNSGPRNQSRIGTVEEVFPVPRFQFGHEAKKLRIDQFRCWVFSPVYVWAIILFLYLFLQIGAFQNELLFHNRITKSDHLIKSPQVDGVRWALKLPYQRLCDMAAL